MVSVLEELTDWVEKQRRGYHKHDGFPEHPVRVLHHEEYFAGNGVKPEVVQAPKTKSSGFSDRLKTIFSPTYFDLDEEHQKLLDKYVNTNRRGLLEQLGEAWDFDDGSQEDVRDELRKEYGDTITVYRGVGSAISKPSVEGEYTNVTMSKKVARSFGKLIETTIPVDSIVGYASADESELIIPAGIFEEGEQVPQSTPIDVDWDNVLERSGPQLGSNPGGIFSDKNTGERFYVKYGNDEQNAVEHLANTLYGELGVTVPNMEIIDFQGDRALKSEWLEGAKSDSSGQSHMASDEVRDNFAIDAWLSNWDVAGMGHDNIVEHDGKMYRIDTGGALYKRARGGDKPSFYNSEVGEIDTLRDSQMNPASAKVFSRVTDEDIRYGVGLLAEIDNDRINELVQKSHLPDEEKDKVATALISRKKNLLDRFGVTPIDKGWIGKQRRAYHKHDGFPEHPVRVKNHQEYFAGDHETPESTVQPTIGEEESVVEQTPIDIPRIEDTREQLVGKHTTIPYRTERGKEFRAAEWLDHLGFKHSGWIDDRDIEDIRAGGYYIGPLKRDVFHHPVLGRLELTRGESVQEISNPTPNFEPELRELEFLSFAERLDAKQNYNLTFMSSEASRRWEESAEKHGITIEEFKQRVVEIAQPLVDNSDIWIRIPQSKIRSLLQSGTFEPVSKSRKMGMGKAKDSVIEYIRAREQEEESLFGIPVDKDHDSRPIYGYLSDNKDGHGSTFSSSEKQSVDNFGTVAVKISSRVRDKTTITFGDSLDLNYHTVGGRAVPSLMNDVKAESMLGNMAVARSLDKEYNSILDTSHDYVEAQIHGGLSIDDIEEIVFHEEPYKNVLKQLEKMKKNYRMIRRKAIDRPESGIKKAEEIELARSEDNRHILVETTKEHGYIKDTVLDIQTPEKWIPALLSANIEWEDIGEDEERIQKSWIENQRRGYHKHDGFPEHPVRVKHHEEYFAGDIAKPDQPSADVPKRDISDIQAEIQNLLARGMKNHQEESIRVLGEEGDPFQGYAPEDMVLGWNLGDRQWVEDKISILGESFDKILSEEDFSQLLQGLENSYSPERAALEAERDRLREIIDSVSAPQLPYDTQEKWDAEELWRVTRRDAYGDYDDIRNKIDEINDKERFFKEVVLGTRPISMLMNNIDALVNSDKWYMNEIASDLIKIDPTADFLMDVVNNEDFNFEMRTKALLALDAKRFDEVMRERYGSEWLAIEDWREDFKMGDVRGEVLDKQRKVKALHKAFGRDAVNHFIEHLEFPDDVQFDLADTFNVMKKDPGRKSRELFIELYDNTTFGILHKASMVQWETSSSSDWGGLLKESIGRQLDGDIVHHTGPPISQLQEQYFLSRPQRLQDAINRDVTIDYTTTQDHLDEYVLIHKKAIRKLLDSVYQDQDYIPVYRGTGRGGEVEETTELKDFKMDEWNPIAVTANPLSSYSLDVGVAHKFAKRTNGWMISSLVNKDDIWSNFWAHSYDGNEREFLLINNERESMGMQSDVWEVSVTNKSPLSSDYDSYGFKGTKDSEYVINDAQKDTILDVSLDIKSVYIPGTPQIQYSVAGHRQNISRLFDNLDIWMKHDNMPASKALEIWNDSIKDAGWKKNFALSAERENLKALANQIKAWTEVLEDKAGQEIGTIKKSQWISKQSSRTMLVPYRTMVNRPTKASYFATRWKKVTVPQRTGTAYNIIPVEEYKGNIQDIYSSWKGYLGDREEGRHDLYLPIIALQEILYKGFDGLLATFNNRIVGVVSLRTNQANEARLSILSASPFDIIQGTENRIEDMLHRGVEIHVKKKGWDYVRIGDHENGHISKQRGQLIPVKVPITLPSGKKTEAIRWKKGKSDPKAFADFDDVFEALKDDPKMKTYLEAVVNKVPPTWNRATLELDMSTDNNIIARAINVEGNWSYIRSTEKDGEIEEYKHKKVGTFSKALPKLRKAIERGMRKKDEEAFILHLIDVGGLRIGTALVSGKKVDQKTKESFPTYGARQLLGKHVSVDEPYVRLQFLAKDGVPVDKTIEDAKLAKFLSARKKKVGDDEKLFKSTTAKVRGYFQKLGGTKNDFKVHFFRHYHATRLIIDALKDYPMPTVDSAAISKVVRSAETKQYKAGGRQKLSQAARKKIVVGYVAKQFRSHQLEVAKASAEFLNHTPAVSLDKYISPAIWSEWEKEQGKIVRKHISIPEPEPKKVRKIKRTVKKQDYNTDEYHPWEDVDDFFARTVYDEESTLDDNDDIFLEDIEEREEQEQEEAESDEGWQYPIDDLSKATTTEGIAEAKRRGLVPQSGDWQKPKRWVRPEDADIPVDEGKKPRKKATVDLKDLNYLKNPSEVERYTENRKKGLEQLPKLFGDDFTVNDLQDIWSSGVDDYSTSIIEIEQVPSISGMGVVQDGVVGEGAVRIFIKITHDPTLADSKKPQKKRKDGGETIYFPTAGVMDRVFQRDIDGNLNVHHSLFQLEPYHQKKGIASDMSEHVEDEYEKLGVHSISFNADADVGGYAWAKQGYDFASTSDRTKIKKHFRDSIKRNKKLFSEEEFKKVNEDIKSLKHAWEFASLTLERDSIVYTIGKDLLLGSKWDAVKILDKKSPGYQIGKAYFAAKRNTTITG